MFIRISQAISMVAHSKQTIENKQIDYTTINRMLQIYFELYSANSANKSGLM